MKPLHAIQPGRGWRWTRHLTQTIALLVLAIAPFLGGWQRLDRSNLGAWDGRGWDLPAWLMARLPLGDTPASAYAANRVLGGGAAIDYVGLPITDPVGGLVALLTPGWSIALALAWTIPILLALVFGRVFCGWLCPFGVLARASDALLERLPWRPPARAIPLRRPVRWAVLALTLFAGVLGAQTALYVLLPHVLVQQTAYACWLMGGGGAVFGWLLGLLAAGLLLGPTTYCAAVCPTGAALALTARRRPFGVFIDAPNDCGPKCNLCTRACWLQLDPATGDPGPDCDACARCFGPCPRGNLRVGFGRRHAGAKASRANASHGLTVSVLALAALIPATADAAGPVDDEGLPLARALHLDASRQVPSPGGDVNVAVSVVDRDLTVFLARGPLEDPGQYGRIPPREVYRGPLRVRVTSAADEPLFEHAFERPSDPISTPRRSLYRTAIGRDIGPDARVVIDPIEGWLSSAVSFDLPDPNPGRSPLRIARGFLAGLLFFGGLLCLALVPTRRSAGHRTLKPRTGDVDK